MITVLFVIGYIAVILTCYIYYGRWLSGLADPAGDLPYKAEIVRIIAAIGTPAIIFNTLSLTFKIIAFLVAL